LSIQHGKTSKERFARRGRQKILKYEYRRKWDEEEWKIAANGVRARKSVSMIWDRMLAHHDKTLFHGILWRL
jgi:hypothetical protein